MKNYVYDSYAIIVFFENETGAEIVENSLKELFLGKANGFMSIINWGEVYYSVFRARGADAAERAISQLAKYPIELVDAGITLTREAAAFKSQHPIAYADCFAAALAKTKKAVLLTGDPEFKRLESQISIKWLM